MTLNLIAQHQYIELLEESLQKPSKGKTIHPGAETSYLKIIAALFDVIRKIIPNAETSDDFIGPISGLKKRSTIVIDELLPHNWVAVK